MFKKLKVALSTFILLSLTVTAPMAVNAGLSDDVGASGSSIYNGSKRAGTAYNEPQWNIALYLNHEPSSDYTNPGTSANSHSSIIGAHVTPLKCNKGVINRYLNQSNGDKKKAVNAAINDGQFTPVYASKDVRIGVSDYITFNSFYVVNPASSNMYTLPYNYSPRGGNLNGGYRGGEWRTRKTDSSNEYWLSGAIINYDSFALDLTYSFPGVDMETLYTTDFTDVFRVNKDELFFYASRPDYVDALPAQTTNTLRGLTNKIWGTNELVPTGYDGHPGKLTATKDDIVIWFVEPLLSADINLAVNDDKNESWCAFAITPAMLAKTYDDYPGSNSGLGGVFRPSEGTTFIDFTTTNGYAGTSPQSIDYNTAFETRNASNNLRAMDYIDRFGTGAYAYIVGWEEEEYLDTLPEIPSVPIFTKSNVNSQVAYTGVSSSVSEDVWSDIIEVLEYGMHYTDTVPSNDLYNQASSYITEMRNVSKQAKDSNGNYTDKYLNAYNKVWDKIINYYSADSVTFNQSTPTSDATTAVPKRNANNQPSAVSSLISGDPNGPYDVTGVLGSIGGTTDLTYKKISVHKLDGNTGIVDITTVALNSLGNKVDDSKLNFADVLKAPYAYSIVIEKDNPAGDSPKIFAPQPPNIVVYDEDSGEHWNATMNSSDFNKVKNTWAYAYGVYNDGSNDLNLQTANDAHKAYNDLMSLGSGSTIGAKAGSMSDSVAYLQYLHSEYTRYDNYYQYLQKLYDELGKGIDTFDTSVAYGGMGLANCMFNRYHNMFGEDTWGSYSNICHEGKEMDRVFNGAPGNGYWNSNAFYPRIHYNPYVLYSVFNYVDKGTHEGFIDWFQMYKNGIESRYYRYFNNVCVDVFDADGNVIIYFYGNIWSNNGTGDDYWTKSPALRDFHGNIVVRDYFATRFAEAQYDTYVDMHNQCNSEMGTILNKLTELENRIKEYENTNERYTNALNNAEEDIMTAFADKYFVKAESTTNLIKNDVTENLYGRSHDNGTDSSASTQHWDSWASKKFNYHMIDVNNVIVDSGYTSNTIYSSYNISGGVDDYITYVLDVCSNISLKGTLDNVIDNKVHTEFKYRVVKTANASVHMDYATIESMANNSNQVAAELSYEMVLKEPYSYGIIINGYNNDTTVVELKEWQIDKVTTRKTEDSSYWKFSYVNQNPYGLTSFDEDEDTHNDGYIDIAGYRPSEGSVTWYTTKTVKDSPIINDNNLTSLTSRVFEKSDRTGKGSYILSNLWNNGTGISSAEILTTTLKEKSYPGSPFEGTITGEDKLTYDNTSGSSFDLWNTQGSTTFRTITPMTWTTYINRNDNDPNSRVHTGGPSNGDDPLPVIFDNSRGRYVFNRLVSGWNTRWSVNDEQKKINSEYEVFVDYKAKVKLKTTFSTDKEDIQFMDPTAENSGTGQVPFIKAGQAITGSITDNVLTIKAYCNVPYNDVYVTDNSNKFKNKDEFFAYMNGIVDQLKACPVAVVSTISEFNAGITESGSATSAFLDEVKTKIGAEYTDSYGEDTDAGLTFNTNPSVNVADKVEYCTKYLNETFYFDSTMTVSEPDKVDSYFENGRHTSRYGLNTQNLMNAALMAGAFDSDSQWFYEYSEGLGYAYYSAEIRYGSDDFNAVVSKYASDSNDHGTGDYWLSKQPDKTNRFTTAFGYNTAYRNTDGVNNVLAPCIDISGLSGDARDLFVNNVTGSGNAINGILGAQTPIHIRGNVYDNT